MNDLFLQAFSLVPLIGGVWLGFRRWVRPRAASLDVQQQGLLLLIILTLLGGFIGAPFWWADVERSFSWNLPPLAARMLGAAAWSFAAGSWMALEKPTIYRMRLVSLMLLVYLTPLVGVIFLFHLNYFDFSAPITYAFIVIAGGMAVANLWYIVRPVMEIEPAPEEDDTPAGIKAWLWAVALITASWGLALFITDSGPTSFIWVWSGDLLTSRLIGAMLLTIAAGSVFSLGHWHVARQMLVVTLLYGLGLTLASLWNAMAGLPIKPAYVVVFGIISIGSALALKLGKATMVREQRTSSSP